MKSSLATRLLLSLASLLGLYGLSVAGINALLLNELREVVLRGVLEGLEEGGALAACDASPSTWHLSDQGLGGVWPLDGKGNPYSSRGPRLTEGDRGSLASLGDGQIRSVSSPDPSFTWTGLLFLSREGPCQRFLLFQTSYFGFSTGRIVRHGLLRGGVLALALGIGWFGVITPLLRRIAWLSVATWGVVTAGFKGSIDEDGEDELSGLARAFNRATTAARERMDLLERRDTRIRELLGNVAHDVRTPLTTLKLAVEGLALAQPGEASRLAIQELVWLEALLGNLSQAVQMEGTALAWVRCRVDGREVLERTVTRFRRLAEGKGVSLEGGSGDHPVPLQADPISLEQAVGNLVHNAVDFASGHVAVLVFQQGSEVVFLVKDDGLGVTEQEVPRLSERFFRGEGSRIRARPGQGLGLSIALEVAHRHGGSLRLRRGEEGGTEAELRLPGGG